MPDLAPGTHWLHLDWVLVVMAASLLIGAAGVAALRPFTFVSQLLFPVGGLFGLGLFIVSLSALPGSPEVAVLPLGLPDLPFHLRLDALSAFFLILLGGVGAAISLYSAGYLRHEAGTWQHRRHGRWQALALAEAACHLTQHEALAWCRWAGRRLPGEAEWERAALTRPESFRWGDVWEWTASPFQPFPGFAAHPYRDYSAPWFDGRPVLRGASFMTQPRLRHPRYRNYFPAFRNDVPAGFRTCAP